MWTHSDRPFKGMDNIAAAAEFIFAAERLISRDVAPELPPEIDRATVEYYLRYLSKKFSGSLVQRSVPIFIAPPTAQCALTRVTRRRLALNFPFS